MKFNQLKESKETSKDRQEKFAEENFVGLEDIGEHIHSVIQQAAKDWKEVSKSDNDEMHKAYRELQDSIESALSVDFIVLNVKMSNVVGHALNAKSTKMIKKLIEFMDTYGIGDKPIHDGLLQIASRRKKSADFLTMALFVAAKNNDMEFVKYIEKFAEKNKSRKNSLDEMGMYEFKHYGDMSRLTEITKKEDIAFEALIHGSKEVYHYFTDGKGLPTDYIVKYIENGKSWYVTRFSDTEITNVLTLEPTYVDDVIEHMPENLPQAVQDIFIF